MAAENLQNIMGISFRMNICQLTEILPLLLHRCSEWFPWRCVELRSWVCVPSYRQRLLTIYSDSLDASVSSDQQSQEEWFERRLKAASLFGQAGLYRESEAMLSSAIESEQDQGRLADLLHALADVSWKAQQVSTFVS